MLGEWLIAWAFAALIIKGFGALWREYTHTRDGYATGLAREHRDWSPRRVSRNARRRARARWWTEIREGFPTLRDEMAKDWLIAEAELAEARAAGVRSKKELRARIKAAWAEREAEEEAARKAPETPEPPPEGAPAKPVLTPISGGKAPTRTGTPAKGTPAEPPVPATPEPPSPEPTGTGGTTGTPKDAPKPEPPAAEPATEGASPVTAISGPGWAATKGVSREEADNFVRTGHTDGTDPVTRMGICKYCDGRLDPENDPWWAHGRCEDIYRATAAAAKARQHVGAGTPGDDALANASTAAAQVERVANGGEAVTTAADLETGGDSAYHAMLSFLNQSKKEAAQAASTNCDAVDAAASATGLSRPPAVAAAFAAIKDAEQARETAYANAARVLTANHEPGDEYHGGGQGANREAFTSS